MTRYVDTPKAVTAEMLQGFFVGWPNPPSPEKHLAILEGSFACALALEDKRVIGFVNAISDGHLSVFIPLLEVLPEFQGRGIGSALLQRLCSRLESFYSIDVICDQEQRSFYERLGWKRSVGMVRRNYDRQSGTDG